MDYTNQITGLKAQVFDVLWAIDQHRNAVQQLEQRKGQLVAELAKVQQDAQQAAEKAAQQTATTPPEKRADEQSGDK